MPTFCFTNPNSGETVERVFSVMRIPKRILIQGEVFLRDISAEHRGESYKIRKRYCESRGIYDRSGGYGDPQQRERVEVPNKDQIDYDRSDAKFVAGED
jgi:hypothetical protein